MEMVRHEADGRVVEEGGRQERELAPGEFSPEQRQLIIDTYCRGASEEEVRLFFAVCRQTGLSPLARQIWPARFWDRRLSREVMTPLTTIDGLRLIAVRTGQHDGMDGPYWCGPDGAWRDVWLGAAPPAAARVVVYRRGASHGFTGVARYDSFCRRGQDGEPVGLWASMPDLMLAKVAEAQALRRGFPQELSGLYTREEMEQAEHEEAPPPARASAATPPPAASAPPPLLQGAWQCWVCRRAVEDARLVALTRAATASVAHRGGVALCAQHKAVMEQLVQARRAPRASKARDEILDELRSAWEGARRFEREQGAASPPTAAAGAEAGEEAAGGEEG
jgi:phage recombination protein Bet